MDAMLVRLFGVVFLLVGSVIIFFLARQLSRALKSRGWPMVDGTIGKAGMKRVEVLDGRGNRGHAATQADYEYAYEVNGRTYTSRRVTFSDNMVKTGGALDKILNQYRKGSTVHVYYNPDDPSDAVLKPGPGIYNYTPFITPLLMIGIGGAMAFFADALLDKL